MPTDNRRFYVSLASVVAVVVFGLFGMFFSLAQDRQQVAVSLASLSVSSNRVETDISDIKATLRIMAEQNMVMIQAVAVLQHQVADIQRRLDVLERNP